MSAADVELARAAQAGDRAAFASLVHRHVAGMRAVAIALLGYTDEADDAVQDAVITALQRLPELREPDAAGAWLKAIVRNNCRMMLRANRVMPVADPAPLLAPDPGLRPDEAWERTEVRDWVRHAVASLSDPVREVTVLRYFSGFSSYQQIADLCGIPLGTVRSRLRDGRRTLAKTLRAHPEVAYRDATAATVASRREAEAAIAAGRTGDYDRMVRDRFHRDAVVLLAGRPIGDRTTVIRLMDRVLGAGVRLILHDAAASRNIMVWETGFVNPPSDPDHCPPSMAWLQTLRDGRVHRLSLTYGRHASQ